MVKCTMCGKEARLGAYRETDQSRIMDEKQICFECAYWQYRVNHIKNTRYVRVNHYGYYLGKDAPNDKYKGFGGARWHIKFHSGKEVITHDLWANGEIPEHFWELLPDNAVFVKD